MTESGYVNANVTFKMMLAAPAGTPKPIVDKIGRDVRAIMKDPAFYEKSIKPLGQVVIADTPEQFKSISSKPSSLSARWSRRRISTSIDLVGKMPRRSRPGFAALEGARKGILTEFRLAPDWKRYELNLDDSSGRVRHCRTA